MVVTGDQLVRHDFLLILGRGRWRIVCLPHRFGDAENAYRRRSDDRLPDSRDGEGFLGAGPGRHRDRDRFERLLAVAAELEMRAGRDGDRDARSDLDDLLAVAELAPHPPSSPGETPDLFDGAMGNRP